MSKIHAELTGQEERLEVPTLYVYRIKEFYNYDGDSFNFTLDLGFDLISHVKTRLHNIDTPELRGGTDDSKAAGRLARDVARVFVTEAMESQEGAAFVSKNYSGKFGRPLGDVMNLETGISLIKYLLIRRLGVAYEGQAKSEVQEQHDANIAFLKKWKEI